MCLVNLEKPKVYTKRSPLRAWKVFYAGTRRSLLVTSCRCAGIQRGRWLKADNPNYGFHVFRTKKAAKAYKGSGEMILPVKLAGKVTFGDQEISWSCMVPAAMGTEMIVPLPSKKVPKCASK